MSPIGALWKFVVMMLLKAMPEQIDVGLVVQELQLWSLAPVSVRPLERALEVLLGVKVQWVK